MSMLPCHRGLTSCPRQTPSFLFSGTISSQGQSRASFPAIEESTDRGCEGRGTHYIRYRQGRNLHNHFRLSQDVFDGHNSTERRLISFSIIPLVTKPTSVRNAFADTHSSWEVVHSISSMLRRKPISSPSLTSDRVRE